MEARSALLELYADELRARGGAAPVAALVRLLAPLGIAPAAVRTVVSRMAREGWLAPVTLVSAAGYALTGRGAALIDGRPRPPGPAADWDGHWHLLAVDAPAHRGARERLQTGLRHLGYGPLCEQGRSATWIAPREAPGVDALLASTGARAERFAARHDGDSTALVARAYDIEALARAYRRFLDQEPAHVSPSRAPADPDARDYAARTRLLHAWREVRALDPGLPPALLPADWPGSKARQWCDAELDRLDRGAQRFIERCLRTVPERTLPERTLPERTLPERTLPER